MLEFDYWKFFAGLGLFLYGMVRLEESLKAAAGRRFKIYLRKYTTNRLLGVLNGTVATALLQSSTLVMLLVIAFTGAGVLSLANSLGIILGANLGTTFAGWLVSFFGFKVEMSAYVFPLIAVGSLGLLFVSRRFLFYDLFGVVAALGLLFLGLSFMKDSMAQLGNLLGGEDLVNLSPSAFFLFGLVVTAIIQSSSAMMTIALTALHAGIIDLDLAAYLVVGADLGTTATALLASLPGTATKKRVGLAHFVFNLVTSLLALIFMGSLLDLVRSVFHVRDPLFALVLFHSLFNAFGIVIFLPFLGLFERGLNLAFRNHSEKLKTVHLRKVSPAVPEAALMAAEAELQDLLRFVFNFNLSAFGFTHVRDQSASSPGGRFDPRALFFGQTDFLEDYQSIKDRESEILLYFAKIQKEGLGPMAAG